MIQIHDAEGLIHTREWGWLIYADGHKVAIPNGAKVYIGPYVIQMRIESELSVIPYSTLKRLEFGPSPDEVDNDLGDVLVG